MSELPHSADGANGDGVESATSHSQAPDNVPEKKLQMGTGTGTNKRTSLQRDADIVLIADRMLKGWTIEMIAAEIAKLRPYTIGKTQIHKDSTKVREKWREEAAHLQRNAMVADLQRYNAMERELWEAWEKSKGDKTKQQASQSTSDSVGGGKSAKRVAKTTQSSHGDPAYMRALMELTRDRAKMMGHFAPQKVEITTSQHSAADNAIDVTETGISPEERKELLKRTYERTFGSTSTGALMPASRGAEANDTGADEQLPTDAGGTDCADVEIIEG